MEIKPTEKEPIYAPENKYGYKINVNHPVIRVLYDRYKKWKGIKMIPSDRDGNKSKKERRYTLVYAKIYRLRKTESLRNK